MIRYTVPLKGKLTVSTRNSILDPRRFRESRIEFRGSSFDFRGSRIEFRGSSFEFRDTKNFSRVSNRDFREMIKFSKTKQAMNKAIDARLPLFTQTRFDLCKYFFVLCIFYKVHAARLSTLKLTANLTFQPYAFITKPAGASDFFSLRDYNPERVCNCFHFSCHLRDFNQPPNVNKR